LALSTESPIQTSLVTTNRQYHRESVEVIVNDFTFFVIVCVCC
jgi:hypothetical protein